MVVHALYGTQHAKLTRWEETQDTGKVHYTLLAGTGRPPQAGRNRAHVLREAIMCCRKGGTISVPGAYVGFPDKLPFGPFMNKGLTLKSGQTHMQRYMKPLFEMIEAGKIDPSFAITHRVKLSDAPEAKKKFRDKKDGCIKVVLKP